MHGVRELVSGLERFNPGSPTPAPTHDLFLKQISPAVQNVQIIQKEKIIMENSLETLEPDFPTKPKMGRRKGLQEEREGVCKQVFNSPSRRTSCVHPMKTDYSYLLQGHYKATTPIFKKLKTKSSKSRMF